MGSATKQPEVRARFMIVDLDCAPELITKQLQITPAETWKVGDTRCKGTVLKFENNGWLIESMIGKHHSVNEHVGELLRMLTPSWETLREISTKYHLELSLTITTYDATGPEVGFDSGIVKKLAEINSHVDIDLYCLGK